MDVIIELLIYIGIVSIEALVWVYIKSYRGDILCRKDFDRMKMSLLQLLQEDGYSCEMNEGRIVLTYCQEFFVIFFEASQFGNQYARVTIDDYYKIEGMQDVSPFIMDAVMGRAIHINRRTPNIAYEDTCVCYYATDVRNIRHYYCGLRSILKMLIENENWARQDFLQFHKDFGRKSQADNENHIGFRPSTGDESEKMQHSVAAESTEKSLPKSAK